MDLTLTALTAAVVTACFVSTGVKDETPVFPIDTISSETVAEFHTKHEDITIDVEIESSLGNFSFYFKHEDIDKLEALYTYGSLDYTYHTARETTVSNTLSSIGAIDIAPILQVKQLLNTTQSSGNFLSYHKSETTIETELVVSSGYSTAAVFFYDLQCATAYFKTNTGTYPYFVYGYYNGKVIFGSKININTPNLSDSITSAVIIEHFFIKGIPAQTEYLTTAMPNIQIYVKDRTTDGITNSVSTTLIARDPSNISPYRIVSSTLSSVDSSFGMIVYTKDSVVEDRVHTVSTQGALSLMPYKLASVVASADSVGTIIPIGGLNIEKDNLLSSTLSNFSELVLHIVQGITHVENTTLSNTNGATLVFGPMLETEGHIESVNSFGTTSVFDVGPYRGEHDLLTASTQQLYVKDIELEHIDSVTTRGQSDVRFGDFILISRTETTITNLGNFKVVYNPGMEPVSNTIVTFGSNFNIVGKNKEASSIVESVSTNGISSIQPYKLLETVENTATTEQVHLFYSHHEDVTAVVSLLYSDFSVEFTIDKPVYKLQTATTEATLHAVVKDATATGRLNTTLSDHLDTIVYNAPVIIEGQVQLVSSSADLDLFKIDPYQGFNVVESEKGNIQLYVKDTTTSIENILQTVNHTEYYVTYVVRYVVDTLNTSFDVTLQPNKIVENKSNTLISDADSNSYAKHVNVPSNVALVTSSNITTLSEDNVVIGIIQTLSTLNTTQTFVKDVEVTTVTNILATAGQSDIQYGMDIQISRTESLVTTLGNIVCVNNPGFADGVSNTLNSAGVMNAHAEHINISGQVLITSTLLGAFTESHVAPVTITLHKNGGTGGTNSIVSVAGFHITPTSITPPTRDHYTFNGYYTMSSGGIQRINSVGTYIALADDTYTIAATLYAQWTVALYTITWKSYANTTLKTEDLTYGSVSTAPTGTTDTAQYDYAWPKSSTTVTGDETITETRTTKSYTITWYAYSGATLKSETLLYGATSTAPIGTSDTAQYDYTWPKSSTTVVGAETITETRTTKSYTITWYFYSGAVAKQETLLYGATSTAPTGTADTAQYQYDWPKASTTVTGTENISETRTLLSYTVTWYKFGQSGETYAKRETLTYGSTSTAPTGTADTAQYDYSWPKTSTTVVGAESITETRVILSYTITWKNYAGTTLKSETLTYGSTSTAPIGTSDTTEYAYTWPKSSTTVVAVETITETRTAKSYTLTFDGNGATPSPATKTVTFGQPYGTLATVSKTNWEHLGWYHNFDTHETPTIIAHWPLDGYLNDISGNRLHGSLQGATPNNEGKIGGSYTFANTRIHTVDFNSYLSTNAYTYTAWINRSSSQNEFNMFMGQGLPYFSFRAGGQLFWSNSVNGTQRTCGTSETFNNNTWYHFTATYDGNYMKIFVNGVEKASSYQPGTMSAGWALPFSIGDGANYTWYPFYGKVNDVRIYNEVLSVDEIKEIAQAKIMHYTFDTCGEPTTNLWYGALSIYNNLGIPATLQATGEYFKNAPVYRLTMTPNTQAQIDSIKANLWNHGVYGSSITYTASTKYHSSIYWKAINKSDIVVNGLASNIGGWASAANYTENSWTRCISYRDGSVAENKTGHVFWSFKSPSATLGDSFIIDWCAPQIEQKDHATDYVLTTREGLLIDSSPYHRDAIMTTNYPAWDFTQNANGRASYRFNYANQDYIALPYFTTDKQAITLSAWMRSNDITKSQNIISRNGPFFIRVTSSTLRVGVYTGTWVFVNGSTTLYSNTWYHLVLTYDGARVKGYVNGVLDIDVAQTGDMAAWSSTIRLGYTTGGEDAPMDGYIDDVRIYATALSQTDIALLYNTQTFITSGTAVRASRNHTIYAHWNPTVASGILHTMATTGQSDLHAEHINIIERTEIAITALGSMQYENQTVFTITLDRQGGTDGTSTITGSTGISITPTSITPPTRTNYTFTGYWTDTSGGTKYINADGTYNNLNSNTFVGTVTLYAQWTMNNVYFDWNPTPNTVGLRGDIYVGGVLQEDNSLDWYQTRPANSVFKVAGLTIPPGWVYSSYTTTRLTGVTVGGSGATTEVQGTGDMTQTAARAIAITIVGITYNVTVVQNGGTGSSASISTYQPKASATTITMTRGTRTNYRFTHWTVSGANGKATVSGDTITIPTYTTSIQPYGDLTITANWLTAIANGIVETTTTTFGGVQTAVATPFTITLDKQSGSGGTSSITCVNGFYLDPTSITVPTRTGYTFNGYYTAASGGTQRINTAGTYVALTNTTYTSATTLYAQWTLITYTLTNDRNGGSGGNNSATYNITTSSTLATLLGTVTRTGYTFNGWKWTSSSAGGWVNGTTYTSNTNVSGKYATGTLQAQWTADNFVITLNANGGTAASNTAVSVTYNTSIEAFNANMVPTKTGYTFNGYYTATSGGTQRISATAYTALTSTTYSAAATLYAQWTAKQYTVSFDANGGSTPDPLTKYVTYDSTYGALALTTRVGYTFAGWFTAASGGTEITSASTVSVTAAQTLYAHWSINYYTVTWEDWNGTTLKTESVAYGGDSTPPLSPTRTGYTFSGWSGTYTNVSSNRTISATYTINYYTVTWEDWNGTTLKTESVAYGGNGTPPTQPTRTGYTFSGWSGDYTGITGSVTITATYTINYYTITFKNYAGSVVDTQSVPYGSTPSIPSGTADTAQYDYSWPSVSTATADKTYQETRAVKSYLITWKAYNGDTLKTDFLNYGSVSTAPTGTADTAQYDYSWPKTSTTVVGTETITETRALKYYTVTWEDWNGTTLKTESVAYGGNGTPPTQPTRTGYTFSGWSGDYTGITGSVTITATYTINSASNWVYLGTSGYSYDLDLNGQTSTKLACPTSSATDTYITSVVPPSNYAVGTIARVAVFNTTLGGVNQCATYFFEAQ